jgi:hypothetical protein
MQLLFKTTSLRDIVGADNDPVESARFLRRWGDNGLDHLFALSSLISVRCSRLEARGEMGYRRALESARA